MRRIAIVLAVAVLTAGCAHIDGGGDKMMMEKKDGTMMEKKDDTMMEKK